MKKAVFTIAVALVATAFAIFLCACDKTEKKIKSDNSETFLIDENTDINKVYSTAQELGYTGTLAEFIVDIKGDSAYEIAVSNGFSGTLKEWLNSLKGASGKDGINGITPFIGDNGNWHIGDTDTGISAIGVTPELGNNGNWIINGVDTGKTALGVNGKSCYELAVQNGFLGTLDEFLNGLKGLDGISVSNLSINSDGELVIILSNGEIRNLGTVKGKDGQKGISIKDASIYENGCLVLKYTDGTEINLGKVSGKDGQDGQDGREVCLDIIDDSIKWQYKGEETWQTLVSLAQICGKDGTNGITPHIGSNNYWYIGDINTGVYAKGINGLTPHIGQNGNWFLGSTDTGVKAIAQDGKDGLTPYIGDNGNWFIGGQDTYVKAAGKDGADGKGIASINKTEADNKIYYEIIFTDGSLYTLETENAITECAISFYTDGGIIEEHDFEYQNDDTYIITKNKGECFKNLPVPQKTGFTFLGWFTGIGINNTQFYNYQAICSDMILLAHWAENHYNIAFENGFDNDKIMPDIKDIAYNTEVILPNNSFIKEHYFFNGWTNGTICYKNNDKVKSLCAENNGTVVLKCLWSPVKYNIQYFLDGGDNSSDNIDTYTVNDTFQFCAPEKTGFTFCGFYTDILFVKQIKEIDKGSFGDIELYAKWQINSYTVSFETKGGEEILPVKYEYMSTVSEPATPKKDGDIFVGWDKDFPFLMPAHDVIVTSIWQEISYSITYHLPDGIENPNNKKTTYKESDLPYVLKYPTTPTSESMGYQSYTWFSDIDKTQIITEIPTGSKDNLEVYLGFSNPISYHIIFQTDTDTENNNVTFFTVEDEVRLLPAKRTGYTFSGWYLDVELSVLTDLISPGTKSDITLYPKWQITSYTLSFDTAGGEALQPIVIKYGERVPLVPTPSKIGSLFVAWDTETPIFMPAADICLTAIWKAIIYTISFNTEGGSFIANLYYEYGQNIVLPENPTKAGYTFLGWDKEIDSKMPDCDIELTAVWQVNYYAMRFDTDGGDLISDIVLPYASVITPPNTSKEGYTFSGWLPELPELMPAADTEYKALWTENVITPYIRVNEENEEDINGSYILYGEFPQSVKESHVSINTEITDERGYFKGSDGAYYQMMICTPYNSSYCFSNGESMLAGEIFYFKIEPIKWRILAEVDDLMLIFCENAILNSYFDSDEGFWHNSFIRSFLNNEFFDIAFDDYQKNYVISTYLDNLYTGPAANRNPFLSSMENTIDDIFLLSYSDVAEAYYGLSDETLLYKKATDYAICTGVYIDTTNDYYLNTNWYLRSTDGAKKNRVSGINISGQICTNIDTDKNSYGVVPAMTIMKS